MWERIKDKITQYPPLEADEVNRLFQLVKQGDLNAREKLFNHNLRLVAKLVEKYKGVYDEDDLFQIGAIGLLKAIDRFDPSMNTMFSTYAVPKILGEIKMYFRDNNPIKISRQQIALSKIVKEMEEKLSNELGRGAKISEIASALGISTEEVVMALEAGQNPTSLEQPISEDNGNTLKDYLEDNSFTEELDKKLLLKEILANLTGIERKVIILRYFQEQSQQKIAERLNISQVHVSRIEKKVINKLKNIYNKG